MHIKRNILPILALCVSASILTGCDQQDTTGMPAGDGYYTEYTQDSGIQCGDGVKEGGEQCDDGNTVNGDGCSSACQTESFALCKKAACGDGYLHSGVEQCDDGNTNNGDGCSSTCRIESVGTACGSAASTAACSAPSTNLCNGGAPTKPVFNATTRRWEWKCGAKQCSTRKRCGYTEINP